MRKKLSGRGILAAAFLALSCAFSACGGGTAAAAKTETKAEKAVGAAAEAVKTAGTAEAARAAETAAKAAGAAETAAKTAGAAESGTEEKSGKAAETKSGEKKEKAARETVAPENVNSLHVSGLRNMNSFSADTMAGGTFTEKDLAEYDVTAFNIWTTWCPHCLKEMRGLELLSRTLPEGMQFVGICADADTEREKAERIVEEYGVTFPVLVQNEELMQLVTGRVRGVPTTVLTDRNGNIIDVITGAPAAASDEDIAKAYLSMMEEAAEKAR